MPAKISLIGQTFGRLKVIAEGPNDVRPSGRGCLTSVCECICGNTVTVVNELLRSGNTRSCGCFRKEMQTLCNTTHGHTANRKTSPTFYSWASMIQRCTNQKVKRWKYYGGRGIKVCKRWKRFENFLEDMGERPERTTLGRINNDGNYEPKNCRWETTKQQMRNTSRITQYSVRGKTASLPELCEYFGTDYKLAKGRIEHGKPIEFALFGLKRKNQLV